ncbi:MAG: Ribonuclease HII [Firmicutes bacterium ADurb.BinA052]|jgi:ribonuclease HII|nr:MAG: Ribonuclease HII [Firmicutes bacterium ADurb.BinA052]
MIDRGALGEFDDRLRESGFPTLAGVDEAGRGPLAGPVVAAVVVMRPGVHPQDIVDSKTLSAGRRDAALQRILEGCVEVSLGAAWQDEIDEINIRAATLLAMSRALSQLRVSPDLVLVDGLDLPPMSCPGVALVKGDARSESVAAASIVAKVARDAIMCHLHQVYPEYGFDRHKGYPTKEHLRRLAVLGPCPLHRRTYRGVDRTG